MKFGFVAVFRPENEVGIDEDVSVGYKGEFAFRRVYQGIEWVALLKQ